MEDITLKSKIVQTASVIVQTVDDAVVVAKPETGDYFGLDVTGRRFWELIREPREIQAIVDIVMSEYDVDRDTCEREIVEFAADLEIEGLVVVDRK